MKPTQLKLKQPTGIIWSLQLEYQTIYNTSQNPYSITLNHDQSFVKVYTLLYSSEPRVYAPFMKHTYVHILNFWKLKTEELSFWTKQWIILLSTTTFLTNHKIFSDLQPQSIHNFDIIQLINSQSKHLRFNKNN